MGELMFRDVDIFFIQIRKDIGNCSYNFNIFFVILNKVYEFQGFYRIVLGE